MNNQKSVLKKVARGCLKIGREVIQFYNSTIHNYSMEFKKLRRENWGINLKLEVGNKVET
jgi:hypothetical protein